MQATLVKEGIQLHTHVVWRQIGEQRICLIGIVKNNGENVLPIRALWNDSSSTFFLDVCELPVSCCPEDIGWIQQSERRPTTPTNLSRTKPGSEASISQNMLADRKRESEKEQFPTDHTQMPMSVQRLLVLNDIYEADLE